MGNPSGPAGHLPCKAEEFCLRTDKIFAAIDFKSVAAYQRGSMKPFFPTEFRLHPESFRHLELGVSGTWNWVFQALELGVSGLGTRCFRL